ncbi:MAG: hypothetical protein QOG09_47 [Solirubrobacterales bacterium]|jgi:hypothetical protein|nr:hypothetical protein [Solirubrobacterales bacterium]MDX6652181.1 hypothetical protein [Solirubrobacterales bacterium]MDX6661945.1 hypothetical protein [Solirubrobacterales bacterium]
MSTATKTDPQAGAPGGNDSPTERIPAAPLPPDPGWGKRIADLLALAREKPVLGIAAAVGAAIALIVIAVVVISSLDGGGSSKSSTSNRFGQVPYSGSSWTDGQPSLASYEEFTPLSSRAYTLGEDMQTAYIGSQHDLDKAQVLARKRARERARQRYLEARRRAHEKYLAALAKAKRDRARKIAAQKRKAAAKLARLRERYKVTPGEECTVPAIRRQFNCQTGYPF